MAMPDGTLEDYRAFNEQISHTVAPVTAAKIMECYWKTDLRSAAAAVHCPTLVFHSRGDARIPFEQGRLLASLIAGARFVPLESRNHLPRENERAWQDFVATLEEFLPRAPDNPNLQLDELTAREREVLGALALGLDNNGIATRLKISEKTVRNHVSIIFAKLGVSSRAQAVAVARDAGFGRERFH